jgi:hypothetical protein
MSIAKQAITYYVYENVQRWRKDIRLREEQRVTVLLAIDDRRHVDEDHLATLKIDFMWMVEPFDGMMMFPMSVDELAQARGIGYLAPGARWPDSPGEPASVAICNARVYDGDGKALHCVRLAHSDEWHDAGSFSWAYGEPQ